MPPPPTDETCFRASIDPQHREPPRRAPCCKAIRWTASLADAHSWHPDYVVIGRTGRSGPGSPMVGSLAVHLLEFTDWPVIVVPESPAQ